MATKSISQRSTNARATLLIQNSANHAATQSYTVNRNAKHSICALYNNEAARDGQLSGMSRRQAISAILATPSALLTLSSALPATAFVPPPPGLRYHEDKLDGYSFFYPEDWLPVTTSGNDVFYRNPFNAEENLFVDVSSPSSSKYTSVSDLGTANEAAQKVLGQFLEEFMSTRLGVKREGTVVSSQIRRNPQDGKDYLDVQTRVQSYASRNQLAVTQNEINEGIELEWDRVYLTVLGVANQRLYSFRLQTSRAVYASNPDRLLTIATSFQCKEV